MSFATTVSLTVFSFTWVFFLAYVLVIVHYFKYTELSMRSSCLKCTHGCTDNYNRITFDTEANLKIHWFSDKFCSFSVIFKWVYEHWSEIIISHTESCLCVQIRVTLPHSLKTSGLHGYKCTLTAWELAGDGTGRGVLWPCGAHRRPLSCTQIWKPVTWRDWRQLLTALTLEDDSAGQRSGRFTFSSLSW